MPNFMNSHWPVSRSSPGMASGAASWNRKPLRILTIGHSYIVGLNRAVMDRVARKPDIELTVVAPKFFQGDLRPLHLEPGPDEAYRLVGVDAKLTRFIHFYYIQKLASVITPGTFD